MQKKKNGLCFYTRFHVHKVLNLIAFKYLIPFYPDLIQNIRGKRNVVCFLVHTLGSLSFCEIPTFCSWTDKDLKPLSSNKLHIRSSRVPFWLCSTKDSCRARSNVGSREEREKGKSIFSEDLPSSYERLHNTGSERCSYDWWKTQLPKSGGPKVNNERPSRYGMRPHYRPSVDRLVLRSRLFDVWIHFIPSRTSLNRWTPYHCYTATSAYIIDCIDGFERRKKKRSEGPRGPFFLWVHVECLRGSERMPRPSVWWIFWTGDAISLCPLLSFSLSHRGVVIFIPVEESRACVSCPFQSHVKSCTSSLYLPPSSFSHFGGD